MYIYIYIKCVYTFIQGGESGNSHRVFPTGNSHSQQCFFNKQLAVSENKVYSPK